MTETLEQFHALQEKFNNEFNRSNLYFRLWMLNIDGFTSALKLRPTAEITQDQISKLVTTFSENCTAFYDLRSAYVKAYQETSAEIDKALKVVRGEVKNDTAS
jgi:hypothetical protein